MTLTEYLASLSESEKDHALAILYGLVQSNTRMALASATEREVPALTFS